MNDHGEHAICSQCDEIGKLNTFSIIEAYMHPAAALNKVATEKSQRLNPV